MAFALLIAYVVLSFLRPGEMFPALGAWRLMEIVSVLAVGATGVAVLTGRGPTFRAPQLPLMLAFLLWAAASIALAAPQPAKAANALVGFASASGVAFLLLVLNVDSTQRLRAVAGTVSIMAVVVVGQGLLAYHGGVRRGQFLVVEAADAESANVQAPEWDVPTADPDREAGGEESPAAWAPGTVTRIRGLGYLNDPNELAQSLVSILPLLLAFRRRGSWLRNAVLVWVPAATLLYGIYLTRSRGGILCLAAVVGFAYRERLGRILSVLLAAGATVALVHLGFTSGRGLSIDQSVAGRVEAWSEGLQMLKSAPIWGVGFASFTEYNELVAHNSFVHCAAEVGLVGYFLWLTLIVLTFDDVRRVCLVGQEQESEESADTLEETERDEEDQELQQWGRALTLSFVGFLLGALFLSRSYDLMLFLLLGIGVASADIARRKGLLPERRDPLLWIAGVAALEVASLFAHWVYLRFLR